MKILFAIKRFSQEFPGHFLATCLTLLILSASGAYAAQTKSYDVTNNPQMYLDVSISNTQTTGIKLSALQRNGVEVTFPTTSGGILRIRQGFRVEDIAYESATVDSSTKVVTLANVTRNLCWNNTLTFISCGDGQYFSKGAVVELSVSAQLLNAKLDEDRINRLRGSGANVCTSASQPCLGVGRYTTSQRDTFTWNTGSTIIFNTTTGVFQGWDGGSWSDIEGSGGVINMTTTAAGKGELATVVDVSGATITGDSTAPVLLGSNLILRGSSGALNDRNKVAATGNNGYLSGSLLGSGYQKNGGRTYLSGTGAWVGAPGHPNINLIYATATGSTKITGAFGTFSKSINLTGSTIKAGDVIEIEYFGETTNADAGNVVDLNYLVGGANFVPKQPRLNPRAVTAITWQGVVKLYFITVGATAMVRVTSTFYCGGACNLVGVTESTGASGSGGYIVSNKTVDLTANPKFTITASQGNGTANNYSQLLYMTATQLTSPTVRQ